MKLAFNSKEDAEQFIKSKDQELGLPKRGVRVGGGIHVEVPLVWDGKGQCPVGWTESYARVKQEASDHTVVVPDELPVDARIRKIDEPKINPEDRHKPKDEPKEDKKP